MADEPEDEVLELGPDLEVEDEDQDDQQDQPQIEDEDDDEPIVQFGDEEVTNDGARDTDLVKHLRAQIRERDKRLAEAARSAPQPQRLELGEKPTLESCEYDEEAFEQELDNWKTRKAQIEQAQIEQQRMQQASQQTWQSQLQQYQAKRAELKFADVDEAEETAASALNEVQQAVIVKTADNPALVLYSLGKHPSKLAEIAGITDPLLLTKALTRMEATLRISSRKKNAPEPEQIARGSARVSKGSDKKLEQLEKEADRLGDRTKLIAYRKSLKQS